MSVDTGQREKDAAMAMGKAMAGKCIHDFEAIFAKAMGSSSPSGFDAGFSALVGMAADAQTHGFSESG